MYLYGNGRLLLEKQDTEKSKGSVNVCDIFPYIRVGTLDNDEQKDRASDQGLTLAYHTLIVPLEATCKNPAMGAWREWEFAFSFDREIREWLQAFAQILSFREQFDEVMQKYQEKKKCNCNGSNVRFVNACSGEDDPAILWSTARGSSVDYKALWTDFLECCSANVDGDAAQFVNTNGTPFTRCLRGF